MSAIPFFLSSTRTADPLPIEAGVAEEASPSARTGRRRLALDICRFMFLTVVGPAAAVLGAAAVLAD
jgi:hypothetical protein